MTEGPGRSVSGTGENHASYWEQSVSGRAYPALDVDGDCDVVVIGAGIVGVTAALKLRGEGLRVILLEARRIGSGATGYTTAKLSSLHGFAYSGLVKSLGEGAARAYGEANQSGLGQVAAYTEQLGIDCEFRRKPNFSYSEDPSQVAKVREEAGVAKRLGLPASFIADLDELPFPVAGAVRFADQAEFHPLKYLHGLAAEASDAGCSIHEASRVVSVDQGEPCRVRTESGRTLTAGHVVVATHMPILDRGLYFARTHPERSYVLLARLAAEPPPAMYLSDESPAHSLRSVPSGKKELIMVGGESHKTGHGDPAERYAALERWARERFDIISVEHSWATQDVIPADGLPMVGRLWPFSDRILTATGLKKWGLAMGTEAATILTDHVLGRENKLAATFDPNRLQPRAGAPDLIKENAEVGWRFVADRFSKRGDAAGLKPGEGAVVGAGLGQRAIYRDEEGALHSVSARCTHLGCIVNFNRAERTWDCPCHGSRFAIDGEVVEGPAVRPLQPRD